MDPNDLRKRFSPSKTLDPDAIDGPRLPEPRSFRLFASNFTRTFALLLVILLLLVTSPSSIKTLIRIASPRLWMLGFWIPNRLSSSILNRLGIDTLAGVEAVISHLVVKDFQIPCAHSPTLSPVPLSRSLFQGLLLKRLDTFLPCDLAGLSNAPQYVVTDSDSMQKDCIFCDDVDSVILPINACAGDGVLAFAKKRKNKPLIITVEENTTVLNDTPERFGIETVFLILLPLMTTYIILSSNVIVLMMPTLFATLLLYSVGVSGLIPSTFANLPNYR